MSPLSEKLTLRRGHFPELWPSVDALAERVYGKGLGVSYWHWKHEAHPWRKDDIIAVSTFDGNRCVGFFAATPVLFVGQDGRKIQGNQILDLMTDPAYQRMGIFDAETRDLFDQMRARGDALSIGFTMKEGAAFRGHLKHDYKYIGNLVQFTKVYDAGAFAALGSLAERIRKFGFALMAHGKAHALPRSVSIREDWVGECNSEEASRLFRCGRGGGFLQWRASGPGSIARSFLVAEHGGTSCGYLLWAKTGETGYVLDCCASGNTAYEDLFRGVDYLACRERLVSVKTHVSPGSFLIRHLRRAGFVKHGPGDTIVLKELGANIPGVLEARNWHLTIADTDNL